MFPMSVTRIFKIGGTATVVESLFSNKNFFTLIPCREIYHVDWYVLNIGRLAYTQSCRLTDSSADKNGLLCKFLKGVLKISKHFQEELCDGVTLE